MDVWSLSDLLAYEGGPYHEFLRAPDLSVGLYRLVSYWAVVAVGMTPRTQRVAPLVTAGDAVPVSEPGAAR